MKLSKKHDPTRTATRVNAAQAQMRKRCRQAAKELSDYVLSMPRIEVNKEYSFETDPLLMDKIERNIKRTMKKSFGDGGWLFEDYVESTYAAGTLQAMATLAAQGTAYNYDAIKAVSTPAYKLRLQLIASRTFEEMEGFTDAVTTKVRGILGRAILDGLNPLAVAQDIANAVNAETYRGERIARTEITTALRRGRMDEADAASEQIGVAVMMMHISAFAPTSRVTHMDRHGKLYTSQDCRLWWSVDANSINCLCSTIEVFVDNNGKPLAAGLLKRAAAIKEKFEGEL